MTDRFGSDAKFEKPFDAVPLYGNDEFASPTRLTIPMLALMMHRRDMFNKITGKMGFFGDNNLFLEYIDNPPQGHGKASHTDVMIKACTQ